MNRELRNKIAENKILTHNERAKIISDLEAYEDLRTMLISWNKEYVEKIEKRGSKARGT